MIKIKQSVYILALLFLYSSGVLATDEDGTEAVSPRKDKGYLIALPVLFYKPETKIAGGLGGLYVTALSDSGNQQRSSSFEAKLLYTQRKQLISEFFPDVWFLDDRYHLDGLILFSKYPYLFHGIGNDASADSEENYVSQIFQLQINLQRKVYHDVSLGILLDMDQQKFLEMEEGGLIETRSVYGDRGGFLSGLGFVFNLDNRDNNLSSTRGLYCQWVSMVYHGLFMSDFDYTQHSFDLRKFIPIFGSHVLGCQGIVSFTTGSPPFYRLSLLGGDNIMRGYFRGRYRDRHLAAMQMEYRMPLFWRVGVVGFFGMGEVASKVKGFRLNGLKKAGGFGFRFTLDAKKRVKLGADIAVAEGNMEYYLSVSEAF